MTLLSLRQVFSRIAFLLLLLAVIWAYWPGLEGSYLFDDIPNLEPWMGYGDIDSWTKALGFALSSTSSPGRPLSLLSFLIDDQSWLPDPWLFKRTNLAIHLLNTCLVLWLALLLLRRLLPTQAQTTQTGLALLVAAIWSLHPIQVSNVAYIIQRMNLLATLLELTALLLFFYGRQQLETQPRQGFLVASLAIGSLLPLSILCKENGLLLCAFALLIERFCFAPYSGRTWRYWKLLFLWLPLMAFAVYCLIKFKGFTVDYPTRDFNAWERLLTQGPVLADYLGKLFLPRMQGSGLYFDNFPISRSLFSPWYTLPVWLLIVSLLVIAWQARDRLPALSFGIFFYFAGHLMESTLLPLELYFEHRNYLPQFGLWIALAGLLVLVPAPRWIMVASTMLVVLLAMMAHNNARLWGSPAEQVAVWYHDNPGSLRTTTAYADMLLKAGQADTAKEVLKAAQRTHPDNLSLLLQERYINCYWQNQPTSFSGLTEKARAASYETATITQLEAMRSLLPRLSKSVSLSEAGCIPISPTEIASIYLALLENPRYVSGHTRSRLYEYLGEIAVSRRQLDNAMQFYDQAFASSANPIYPYRQAMLLISAGLYDDARHYVRKTSAALTSRQRLRYPDLERRVQRLSQQLGMEEPS